MFLKSVISEVVGDQLIELLFIVSIPRVLVDYTVDAEVFIICNCCTWYELVVTAHQNYPAPIIMTSLPTFKYNTYKLNYVKVTKYF